MIVITAHNMMDFDALASMVAARKLYPEAQLVFSGLIAKSAQEFVALNKELLNIKELRAINLQKIKHVIIVDTADPKRLPGFEEVLANPDLVIDIYDHHPPMEGDLQGDFKQVERTGAAATLLVEQLQQREIALNEFEATTIALGIYADTGGMLHDTTTTRDVEAVSWLLKQGANLEIIRENMDQRLSDRQMEVFHQCLMGMQLHSVAGVDILLCQANTPKRVAGLDVVTMRLFAVEGAEAIFVLAQDPKSVEVIGRSSSHYVDVSKILQPLGGRGHLRAASAKVKKSSLEEVKEALLQSIQQHIRPSRCARDVMTSPVKTLPPDTTLEEAGRIMLRYGHTGMPIVQDGKLVGMISRRDVDKARMHHLEHASVKGFMSTQLIQAKADTPVDHLQDLIASHDIGRIPIVENNELIGIVSRSDILRELYQKKRQQEPAYSEATTQRTVDEAVWNYAKLMQETLSPDVWQIFRTAGAIAQQNQQKVYVVGGLVRDLLLGEPNQDIDLVVEGDGKILAEQLAQQLGGELKYHERFQTANIVLPNKKSLDVVTARAEYYEYPAALPQVEKSCIREDLYRRDFTINAMAICLNPEQFGDLIDFFGGREDLKNQVIRVLYHFSFIEDPTRIVRAIRFAKRYHFAIEEDTMRMALDALKRGMVGYLSKERFWHEIMLVLKEPNPVPVLQELRHFNILTDAIPQLENSELEEDTFRLAKQTVDWWQENLEGPCQRDRVYVMVLLLSLPAAWRTQVAEMLHVKTRMSQEMQTVAELLPWMKAVDWKAIPFSQIDEKLQGLSPEALVYCMVKSDVHGRKRIRQYLLKRQETHVAINGNHLKALGFKPGPDFHRILERLYHMRLDGEINSLEEEEHYLAQWQRGEAQS